MKTKSLSIHWLALAGATALASLFAGRPAAHGQDLYVASFGSNTVGEYDASTGALIDANFVTGLDNPYGLAVSDVPEPSTWALLGSGAGWLGLILRRRSLRA